MLSDCLQMLSALHGLLWPSLNRVALAQSL